MEIAVPAGSLVAFCLALVRTTAWIIMCPPFNAPAVPMQVRVGLATAIAFVVADDLGEVDVALGTGAFVVTLLVQALAGLLLGFSVYALFAAIQAAGDLIDLQVGFSIAAVLDPLSGAAASPIARLHQMLALTLMLGLNGHVMVVSGYLRSVEAVPTGEIDLAALGSQMVGLLGTFMVAAVEIALPVLAALFCADIALGLLTKAAPQLNVMVIGFAAKTLVALLLLGLTFALLPETTESIIGQAVRSAGRAFAG